MSTENNEPIVEPVTDDLDAFAADLFGHKSAPKEEATSEEAKVEDSNEESDAEETHESEDDTTLDENEDAEEDQEEKTPNKPKKNRFQERIDKLTGEAREAQRAKAALEEKLEALISKLEQNDKPTPVVSNTTGPIPDAKNEDGTEKYPLGEFDPQYIRDLTKFTLEEERKTFKDRTAQEEQQKEMDRQRAELHSEWHQKLGPAQERYPDFQEKGEQLLDTFSGIDSNYGEYLTATIMSMEYGPDVLYYLSTNVDEAEKIIASGATKATIALGRLESKFAFAEEEKQRARPKISKAPPPPAHLNKGSAAAKIEVDDDTDDLDAFAAKLFKKR